MKSSVECRRNFGGVKKRLKKRTRYGWAAAGVVTLLAIACAGTDRLPIPAGTIVDLDTWVLAVPEGGWDVDANYRDEEVVMSRTGMTTATGFRVYRKVVDNDAGGPDSTAKRFLDGEEWKIRGNTMHTVVDLTRGRATVDGRHFDTLSYRLKWAFGFMTESGVLYAYAPSDVATSREIYAFLVSRTSERLSPASLADLPSIDPLIKGFRIRRETARSNERR